MTFQFTPGGQILSSADTINVSKKREIIRVGPEEFDLDSIEGTAACYQLNESNSQ
jgi:hypothetical protein